MNNASTNDPQGAHEYRAVRLSQGAPETQNLVTTMASPEYPQGYYPSCADLIEVTAQMTTTTATIPALEPNDPYNPVNMCGPFTVRWYLDPKPQVRITRRVQTQPSQTTYNLEIGVVLQTSPMLGNTTGIINVINSGSSYQWQYRVLQAVNGYISSGVAWQNITEGVFSDNFRMSGTFNINGVNALALNDSVEVRCVTTFPNAMINPVIDQLCRVMNSAIVGVVSVRPENVNANFTAQEPSNDGNPTLVMTKNSTTTQGANAGHQTNTHDEETPPSAEKRKLHTVNLLAAPNPAETQVGLRFKLPSEAITTIEIVDALQRTILAPMTATTLKRGEHEISLSVGTLPSGTYSIRVKALLENGVLLFEQRTLIVVR